MKHKKISLTTLYIIIICVLLLAANTILGLVLMSQSSEAMTSLIKKNMMSVANTAAVSINGDLLDTLKAEDVGTDKYEDIATTLLLIKNIQHDNDIKYIYIIDKIDGKAVYIVDPDPINPADFGEEIVYTEAQEIAFTGVSAVDDEIVEDEWGSFYTAWAPVFNSKGEVSGVVGIDFVADWFNAQIARHTTSMIIISALSIVIGIFVILLLVWQLRNKFKTIHSELSSLSNDLDKLSNEIQLRPNSAFKNEQVNTNVEEQYMDSGSDIVNSMTKKIAVMRNKLDDYLEYVHNQAYTDTMTKVENKTAYLERVKDIKTKIVNKTANFAIVICDVNGLKNTNDNYGHECGDQIIIDTAKIMKHVFNDYHTYRIGGDEFITIVDNISPEELNSKFDMINNEIDSFNKTNTKYEFPLSFSYGYAIYDEEKDSQYKEVFKRADQDMYKQKNEYYKTHASVSTRNYDIM